MNTPTKNIEWPIMLDANIAIMIYAYEQKAFTVAYLGEELCDENESIVSHDNGFECSLDLYGTIMELINDDNLVRIPVNGYDIYINPRLFSYAIMPTPDASQLIICARLECDGAVYTKHLVANISGTPWAITRKYLRDLSFEYGDDSIIITTPGAVTNLGSLIPEKKTCTNTDEAMPCVGCNCIPSKEGNAVPRSIVGATPCARRRRNDTRKRRADN